MIGSFDSKHCCLSVVKLRISPLIQIDRPCLLKVSEFPNLNG